VAYNIVVILLAGLRIRCLFDPSIRDPAWAKTKKSRSGSVMNNLDYISESLETIFWTNVLQFFDADPGSGMEKFGSVINIPDPQHCFPH
jgi:hypothetical protein